MADFYYISHGRIIRDLSSVPAGMLVQALPRLLGGKGGFGSMLRAIGSQIEKTTNREMCRDLTGRRMRDVHMEKQLKEWLSKASQREREKIEKQLERRKRRRDLLEKGPLASHKFEDNKYDQQKSFIADQLEGALESILRDAKKEQPKASTSNAEPPVKKKRLLLDQEEEDLLNELSSSSSSSSNDIDNDDLDEDSVLIKQSECLDNTGEDIAADKEEKLIEAVAQDDTDVALQKKEISNLQSDKDEEQEAKQPVSIEEVSTAKELEPLGLDALKVELMNRGLKCGGTLNERAVRLFSVIKLKAEDYPTHLKAKPIRRK